jgi:flagellar assembly protein FliH
MTSSSSPVRTAVLRGGAPNSRPARMNADLSSSPFATGLFADARLVDPALERVVAEAAERAAADARETGFAAGYAEGRALAVAELATDAATQRQEHERTLEQQARDVARAVSALAAAATALEHRLAPSAEQVERLALQAAVEIAESVLGRELALTATPALDAVRRALTLVPADGELIVHLHPADAATAAEGVRAAAMGRAVQVVEDPSVEPGGCVVDSGACHVDAQIGPALDRIRAALA